MSSPRPPRFATWLLTRFATGPQADSLIGDLVERFESQPSRPWYWRQVFTAIAANIGRDIGSNKLLAVRAVVSGWGLALVLSFPVNWLAFATQRRIARWLAEMDLYSFWAVYLSGQVPGQLFAYVACVITGWMVARLHRQCPAAMVSMFALSWFALETTNAIVVFSTLGSRPMPLGALVLPAVLGSARPIFILAGGLLAASRANEDARHAPGVLRR